MSTDYRHLPRTPLVRIVDDDIELLKSMTFLIEMAGFEVQTYSDATSFLRFDDATRPGCILLDQRMPGLTGLEVQEILVERSTTLPIIFISAHGTIPMAMQAVHRGAMDFLEKPVDTDVLLNAIERAMEKCLEEYQQAGDSQRLKEAVESLTERELEVAHLVSKGLLNKQIAEVMNISLHTVKMHRGNVTRKLHLKSAVAIARALQEAGVLNGMTLEDIR